MLISMTKILLLLLRILMKFIVSFGIVNAGQVDHTKIV